MGWLQLGRLQTRGGYLPAAKASFERLLALRSGISDPQLVHWAHMLLGDVEAALGNRPPALVQYDQALVLIKALAERDPANAEWQTDLVVSAWKLASAGAPEACGHLRNGLAILKRLDAENRLTADQKEGWIPGFESLIAKGCG